MASSRFTIQLLRNYQTHKPRIPLIKFPDRSKTIIDEGKTAPKPSSNGKTSTAIPPPITSTSKATVSILSYDLPYTRKLLTEEEIDAIESGGSSTIY